RGDLTVDERLYECLYSAGFSTWMDLRILVHRHDWPPANEDPIETADFFIACFSEYSVNKKGGFQAEIRYALDCAGQLPLVQIFIVPVRLNGCSVPRSIQKEFQYVDLFPDWQQGMRRVLAMMRRETA